MAHPDFTRTLTTNIGAWCARNGVTVTPANYGFYFSKGERFITPIAATDSSVCLMVEDRSEDGDGARQVATFPRLSGALRALIA